MEEKVKKYISSNQLGLFAVTLAIAILLLIFGVFIIKGGVLKTLIISIGILALLLAFAGLKFIYEYERGVLFTFGKYTGLLKPGLAFAFPMIQSITKVDIRVRAVDISKQEVMTKDNVPVYINAVVFYKVKDVESAVLKVEDYEYTISMYAQTVLRDVTGSVELDELLEKRENVAERIRTIVDEITDKWGIDVVGVKLQDITLPEELKRAMARQAEAERERRAIIIKSEGEIKAAENLIKAAETLSTREEAIQLRLLHTLADISGDPSQKIIIIIPSNLLNKLK